MPARSPAFLRNPSEVDCEGTGSDFAAGNNGDVEAPSFPSGSRCASIIAAPSLPPLAVAIGRRTRRMVPTRLDRWTEATGASRCCRVVHRLRWPLPLGPRLYSRVFSSRLTVQGLFDLSLENPVNPIFSSLTISSHRRASFFDRFAFERICAPGASAASTVGRRASRRWRSSDRSISNAKTSNRSLSETAKARVRSSAHVRTIASRERSP